MNSIYLLPPQHEIHIALLFCFQLIVITSSIGFLSKTFFSLLLNQSMIFFQESRCSSIMFMRGNDKTIVFFNQGY